MSTTAKPIRIADAIELPVAGTWVIDQGHAQVSFVGRHLMFTKVRGRFDDVSGIIAVADDPDETTVEVTVGVASVDSGNDQRDDHLRSPDLFDVARFPKATFRGRAAHWSGDQGLLTGELTIKGVTQMIEFAVRYLGYAADPWGGDRIVFSASATIDREAFGITWNVALEAGGLLVSKEITLEIELEAIHQP